MKNIARLEAEAAEKQGHDEKFMKRKTILMASTVYLDEEDLEAIEAEEEEKKQLELQE